jgi:ppGpp synthetase/RelA/SpoT-type nucleotidyltranferase
MHKITENDRKKIEEVREKKERTLERVMEILKNICRDNPDIFKKQPECRVKGVQEIGKKMKSKKGCNLMNFEKHVRDIAGTRITCCTLDEIDETVELIRKHPEIKNCKTLRKYTDGPDEFGYRGHHLEITVQISYKNKTINDICEVQIRTLAGDLWAVLSRRDFYKPSSPPPVSVHQDMRTLSKQLEVVDEIALSLKQRCRSELEKEAKEKAVPKTAAKDMLTLENVMDLIDNIFGEKISVNEAYELIQEVLTEGVNSLKNYKKLITNRSYHNLINNVFKDYNVTPNLKDYLFLPIMLKTYGLSHGRELLNITAEGRFSETMLPVNEKKSIRIDSLAKAVKMTKPKRDSRRSS